MGRIVSAAAMSHVLDPRTTRPRVGESDVAFDRKLLHWLEAGEHEPLQALTPGEGGVSRYGVNSLLYRLKKDRAFRDRFAADPPHALAGLDLTEAERAAFVARDMYRINELGGYLHLVMSVPGMAAHVTRPDHD